jgi:hypothetical protein
MSLDQRTCRITGATFQLTELERELLEKFHVPPPTVCPAERMRTLCAFNNYLNLFHGTCAATGQPILQVYRPNVSFPVYSVPYWWSDAWDASTFGRPFDFTRGFFDQMLELRNCVPQPALSVNYATLENCDFVNGCSFSKNCYLCFLCIECQDCHYCFDIRRSRDCIDCSSCYDSELCYDSTFLFNCYDIRSSFNCRDCSSCVFLRDCNGCRDCYGCFGLTGQRFCYLNQQLTEAEYREHLSRIQWDDANEMRDRWKEFEDATAGNRRHERLLMTDDCTGDFLHHAKRAEGCERSANLENCASVLLVDGALDAMDVYTWGAGAELIYCSSRVGTRTHNVKLSYLVYNGASNLEYCMNCIGCRDCFGCVGLRQKQYCILNKEYSAAEYCALRARIIAQMNNPGITIEAERYGEFFPARFSLFPFNDSDAMIFASLTQDEATQRGFAWAPDIERTAYTFTSWNDVPKRTKDVSSSIVDCIFRCPASEKPLRFSARELELFNRRSLPLPRTHWLVRCRDRLSRR